MKYLQAIFDQEHQIRQRIFSTTQELISYQYKSAFP